MLTILLIIIVLLLLFGGFGYNPPRAPPLGTREGRAGRPDELALGRAGPGEGGSWR